MISSAYRVGPLQVGPIVTTIWNPQYVKEVQAGRSIIQFLIRRIEQFLNSPIQFIDFIELINSIRNLRIEAICDQFAGWSSRVRLITNC